MWRHFGPKATAFFLWFGAMGKMPAAIALNDKIVLRLPMLRNPRQAMRFSGDTEAVRNAF
jgi:hypothetical protein